MKSRALMQLSTRQCTKLVNSRGIDSDQVLFLAVLDVKFDIGEMFWESSAHGERFFGVTNAYSECLLVNVGMGGPLGADI